MPKLTKDQALKGLLSRLPDKASIADFGCDQGELLQNGKLQDF